MAFLFFNFGILEEIEVVRWDYRMMVVEAFQMKFLLDILQIWVFRGIISVVKAYGIWEFKWAYSWICDFVWVFCGEICDQRVWNESLELKCHEENHDSSKK
jgi:hypothetical protein